MRGVSPDQGTVLTWSLSVRGNVNRTAYGALPWKPTSNSPSTQPRQFPGSGAYSLRATKSGPDPLSSRQASPYPSRMSVCGESGYPVGDPRTVAGQRARTAVPLSGCEAWCISRCRESVQEALVASVVRWCRRSRQVDVDRREPGWPRAERVTRRCCAVLPYGLLWHRLAQPPLTSRDLITGFGAAV